MVTLYTTTVDSTPRYVGEDLEAAIRTWDRETFRAPTPGGIAVQTFEEDGTMVRDGWILHVTEDGVVYLNPNLSPA